jgi:hypothetical protein
LLIAAPHAQEAVRTPPTPVAPAHNTVVLTGCLAAGAAGSDESTFMLTNAAPNAQASASQPQTAGTTGGRAQYELRAEKNLDKSGVAATDLKALVGHQVEVTARPSEEAVAPAQAQAKADTGTKADPDPGKPAEKPKPLTVIGIKQTRGTCR